LHKQATAAARIYEKYGSDAISRASQPRLTELFAVNDLRGTNVVYQVTTAWLILLTWPIYLLAMVYGPQALAIFGHTYKSGTSVIVILSLATIVGSLMGQVDIVLVTAGKSSWSLLNGLLVLITNLGLDLWLIPTHGILGAAIAWAVAMTVSNVVPLAQLALVFRLHPFGRGSLIASVLTVISFGLAPLSIHAVLGDSWYSVVAGVLVGSVLMVLGLARFRRGLRLSAMPGMRAVEARIQARWPRLLQP